MEGSVTSNSYNIYTKNPPLRVGILNAPDDHYRPVLYSHVQATKDFNNMSTDLYLKMRDAKPQDRHKTPKSIYYLVAAGILTPAFLALRKFLKK